jgi:hypothetical protein
MNYIFIFVIDKHTRMINLVKKIFRKLFFVNEIKSNSGDLHFQRWRIIQTKYFSIFIHNIYIEDKDIHLHNHPWNFSVFILKGGYIEELEDGEDVRKPFGFKSYKSEKYHKIKKLLAPTKSIAFVGKRYREWGYLVDGEQIDKDKYRKMKKEGLIR